MGNNQSIKSAELSDPEYLSLNDTPGNNPLLLPNGKVSHDELHSLVESTKIIFNKEITKLGLFKNNKIIAESIQLLDKAAKLGNLDAAITLSEYYTSKISIPNYKLADKYNKILANENQIDYMFKCAIYLYERANYEKSIELLDRADTLNPPDESNHIKIICLKAKNITKLGKSEEAIKLLGQEINVRTNNKSKSKSIGELYYTIAIIYAIIRDFSNALKIAQVAMEHGHPETQNFINVCSGCLGNDRLYGLFPDITPRETRRYFQYYENYLSTHIDNKHKLEDFEEAFGYYAVAQESTPLFHDQMNDLKKTYIVASLKASSNLGNIVATRELVRIYNGRHWMIEDLNHELAIKTCLDAYKLNKSEIKMILFDFLMKHILDNPKLIDLTKKYLKNEGIEEEFISELETLNRMLEVTRAEKIFDTN